MIGNLSVAEAARIMHKSQKFVRLGLEQQRFPFGVAVQTSKNQWSFHISPVKFYEYMGIPIAPEEKAVPAPSIKVAEAAQRLGANPQGIRECLKNKLFPFGEAVKTSSGRYTYFINRRLFDEYLKEHNL